MKIQYPPQKQQSMIHHCNVFLRCFHPRHLKNHKLKVNFINVLFSFQTPTNEPEFAMRIKGKDHFNKFTLMRYIVLHFQILVKHGI